MSKSHDQLAGTKRLMGVLGRMPPKPHEEMKINKSKLKQSRSPIKSKRKPIRNR